MIDLKEEIEGLFKLLVIFIGAIIVGIADWFTKDKK
jgi:hypothetical protein